jgi:hypothetical protein
VCHCKDRKKLAQLLGYLKGTVAQRLVIPLVSNLQLHAYIDVSFALHDIPSHTLEWWLCWT